MKVKELIKKLQECDPDALVVHDNGDADAEVRYVTKNLKFVRRYAHWDYGIASESKVGEKCVYIE